VSRRSCTRNCWLEDIGRVQPAGPIEICSALLRRLPTRYDALVVPWLKRPRRTEPEATSPATKNFSVSTHERNGCYPDPRHDLDRPSGSGARRATRIIADIEKSAGVARQRADDPAEPGRHRSVWAGTAGDLAARSLADDHSPCWCYPRAGRRRRGSGAEGWWCRCRCGRRCRRTRTDGWRCSARTSWGCGNPRTDGGGGAAVGPAGNAAVRGPAGNAAVGNTNAYRGSYTNVYGGAYPYYGYGAAAAGVAVGAAVGPAADSALLLPAALLPTSLRARPTHHRTQRTVPTKRCPAIRV
jgi:hypothetical protein